MRTVMITGTTSGIGASFSKIFAKKKGCHVILVSRDQKKLEEQQKALQGPDNRIDVIVCDLQQPGAARIVHQAVTDRGWKVDELINNAGFNEAGYFIQTDGAKEQAMIELHISFVTEMMKLFVPDMAERGKGRIMNIGSTGSYIACPKDAVYAATKAYVLHLSRAVNAELRGTGVSVTTLCPGSTRTEFAKKADIEQTLLFKLFVMSPDKVAAIGYKGMRRGKEVVVPGIYNKLLVFCSRVMPYRLLAWMTKKML